MRQILQNIVDIFKRFKSNKTLDDKANSPQMNNTYHSHLYPPDNSFFDTFYSNLIATINWTEKIVNSIEHTSQINYSTILRVTNPDYEGKPFYRYKDTWSGFAATPEISFNYLSVLQKALTVRTDKSSTFSNFKQLGQILEFDIDETTHDGAPCAESEGFVDESDIPPIDTWFYLTKTKLYCWIPTLFIEKMQGAIDVEIFDSYRWIKDSNPTLQLETIDRLESGNNN